jgi:L-ribulose-5-phosphate 3-epimerase
MPNIDINIGGASREMREYSLDLLSRHVRLAGEIGAPATVLGPGKANPLFAPPREELLGRFYEALDRLIPIAEKAGTRIIVENMPFAFLPKADEIMSALANYGNDNIGVLYDIANSHFVGEDSRMGLRTVRNRLSLVHISDTTRSVFKHDPVGQGDVPFVQVPPVLSELGYREMPVLEIVSHDPFTDVANSAAYLAQLGYRWEPTAATLQASQ